MVYASPGEAEVIGRQVRKRACRPALASDGTQRLNEQLSGALTSRVVIEQAKGVISERADVDLAEAFSRLRAYARNHNLRLTDVARAAIDGTLDPLAWATASLPILSSGDP
jgi:ANTAR domain